MCMHFQPLYPAGNPINTATHQPPLTTTCPTCPMTTCPTCPTTTSTCQTTTCQTTTCPTTTCPTTTCPTCPTHATSEATTAVDMTDSTANTSTDNLVGEKNQPAESCPSLAAVGGGLGGLCVILAILLVGVVMGWVWSCHRKTRKFELQER